MLSQTSKANNSSVPFTILPPKTASSSQNSPRVPTGARRDATYAGDCTHVLLLSIPMLDSYRRQGYANSGKSTTFGPGPVRMVALTL